MRIKKLVIVLLLLFIVGCDNSNINKEINLFESELIIYANNDSQDGVTKDFEVVTKLEGFSINWISSNSDLLKIEDYKVLVTRTTKDEFVTLKASYKIKEEVKTKSFLIVILGTENGVEKPPVEDTTPPVISGISDMSIFVGTEIDFLNYVKAIDDVDGEVEVSIKESNLDINTPGKYKIIFEASDSAGNSSTLEINVNVIVEEKALTYKEDFNNSPLSSNQYTSTTFTGNHGIIWEAIGVRGDLFLDDKALTFAGGSADNSKIKTQLTGGISYFCVDLKKAFTSNNKRKVALLINGEQVGEFTLDLTTEDVQKFELELDMFGDYTLELIQIETVTARAQITIDNIVIINNPRKGSTTEEQDLNKDFERLNVLDRFIESGSIHLPKVGEFASSITWKYTEESENNNLINLETNDVYLPSVGIKEVKIDAIIRNGTFEKIKTFTIVIGEGEANLISDIHQDYKYDKIKIKGLISNIFITENGKRFFIQDNSSGILVHFNHNDDLSIGDEVELIAEIKETNDYYYLDNVTKLNKLNSNVLEPISNLNQDLENLVGKLVNLTGLMKFSYGNTNEFYVVDKYNEYLVYIPNDLLEKESIIDKISGRATAIGVDIYGVIYKHNDKYSIYLTNIVDVEVEELVNLEKINEVIHSHLNFPTNNLQVKENLILPTEADLFIGLTITWNSSNQDILNNFGVIYPSDNDEDITLKYNIYIDNNLISENTIVIKVLKRLPFTGYYERIEGLTGEVLKNELSNLISVAKNYKYQDTSYVLEKSDIDLRYNNQLLLVYSRTNTRNVWNSGANWNKEHVWPDSKIPTIARTDIHNLRAIDPGVNSVRGNSGFAEGSGKYGHVDNGWYPGDDDRGDVARIILFMSIRWDLEISATGSNAVGDIQMFLRWHIEDPVDEFEKHRNNVIYENQENRNPFIDHPELAEMIFGPIELFNEETQSIEIELVINFDPVIINYYDFTEERKFI